MRVLNIVDRLSRVADNTLEHAGRPPGSIPPTRSSNNSNLNPPPTRPGPNPRSSGPNGTPRPDDPMAVNFSTENTSTHMQRHVMSLSRNETRSLEAINAAVDSERSNPLLILMRSLAQLRHGNQASARQDALSAERIGDYPNWVMPNYLLQATDNSLEDAIDHADEIIEIYPNDWYALTIRGLLHIEDGNLLQAQEDFANAIELEPQSNVTYVYAALLALQFGDFDTATRYTNIILRDFPDPTFYTRLVTLARDNQSSEEYERYLTMVTSGETSCEEVFSQ